MTVRTGTLLRAELLDRQVLPAYRGFLIVGPDSFGIGATSNPWPNARTFVDELIENDRIGYVDIIGGHFYPQHGSGVATDWEYLGEETGKPLWHTEVHMPTGSSDDLPQVIRDTLAVLFASNRSGVDSFVWWSSGARRDRIADTVKRELVTRMLGAVPVETTPSYTARNDPDNTPLYQAYLDGDELTLWISNPHVALDDLRIEILAGVIDDDIQGTFWMGRDNTIFPGRNSGPVSWSVDQNGRAFTACIPADAVAVMTLPLTFGTPYRFRRGDCNDDGGVDISDAVSTLGSLFLGEGDPGCDDACDSNDDGAMDISDAIATLGVLFLGNGVIPLPGMNDCGIDPTDDELGCDTFERCQ